MIHDDIFYKTANALLSDYSSVYYLDADMEEYCWYSTDPEFHSLRLGHEGKDFFADIRVLADTIVCEDDREAFKQKLNREAVLAAVNNSGAPRFEYRIIISGNPVWHTVRIIHGVRAAMRLTIM